MGGVKVHRTGCFSGRSHPKVAYIRGLCAGRAALSGFRVLGPSSTNSQVFCCSNLDLAARDRASTGEEQPEGGGTKRVNGLRLGMGQLGRGDCSE